MIESFKTGKRVLAVDDERSTLAFYEMSLVPSKQDRNSQELDRLTEELFGTPSQEEKTPANLKQRFDLTLCRSATEAVEHVIASIEEKRPFAVVFLDVRMPPGPDGIWAASQIRKIDPWIEIVIATAFSDIHPGKISVRVPPVHKLQYIQKPFHPSEINHMASSLVSKWEMEQELMMLHEKLSSKIISQRNELTEAYKTLERIQKLDALGMVTGGIAHDFNNILSCIVGNTELALLSTPSDNKMNKQLKAIYDACMRAKKLTRQILTFSKQKEPENELLNPLRTIREVIELISGSLPKNIELEEKLDSVSVQIIADHTQVHQVLMNLCANAIEAMKQSGGKLTIALSETREDDYLREVGKGPHLLLIVRDTGHGMDKKTMEAIFDPYFTTRGKDEGTGLGLAVTHGIVQRQGGFIDVESKPGRGTSFYVIFKGAGKR